MRKPSAFCRIAICIILTRLCGGFSPKKSSVYFEIKKENHVLSPPRPLQLLSLHETITPVESLPHLKITRISLDPDAFLLTNFLSTPVEQIDMIRAAVNNGMDYSGTSAGDVVSQRFKSYTSWIYPYQEDEGSDHVVDTEGGDNHCGFGIDIDDEVDKNGRLTAKYMTDLAYNLFCPEGIMENHACTAEAVQVVRYEKGGKYDFHHDGFNRFLTVLCYLNGIAGTWFPHAIVDQTEYEKSKELDKRGNTPDFTMANVAEGKVKGKDGLLLVGSEYEGQAEDCVPNIVKVNPGDALVFYSYDWIVTNESNESKENNETNDSPPTGPLMNYRSLHSGLTAEKDEKWIATNWFRLAKN